MCDSKQLRFIKQQEANGLLSSLGLKTSFSKLLILGDVLFQKFKVNEIASKFLLTGAKFMPEMHRRHPGFIYIV